MSKLTKELANALDNLGNIQSGAGIRSCVIIVTDGEGTISQQVVVLPDDALQTLGSLEVVKASLTSYFLQQSRPLAGLN